MQSGDVDIVLAMWPGSYSLTSQPAAVAKCGPSLLLMMNYTVEVSQIRIRDGRS
jgi:hypothetical protein